MKVAGINYYYKVFFLLPLLRTDVMMINLLISLIEFSENLSSDASGEIMPHGEDGTGDCCHWEHGEMGGCKRGGKS